MDITRPSANPVERWYVSNGLLVVELITGQMQVGDSAFDPGEPAPVNVAGDPDATIGPTSASVTRHLDNAPFAESATLTQTIDRTGQIVNRPELDHYDATTGTLTEATNHRTTSVFQDNFAQIGPLRINGRWQVGQVAGMYEVGLPITEAYWARVMVRGAEQDVLIQCFE